MDEKGLVQQAAQVQVLPAVEIGLDEAADLEDADDVVNAPLVHGQAAVVLGLDLGEDVLQTVLDIDGLQVHPGGQDALHRHLAELQGGGNELALLFVQAALLGHVLDDIVELILGDGDLRLARGQGGGAAPDQGQQGGEGPEQDHEEAQGPGGGLAEPLRILFGDALGQHLPGKEDHDSGHDGAHGHGAQPPETGNRHGDQGGRRDMYDVGADEQGADGPVKMIQHV